MNDQTLPRTREKVAYLLFAAKTGPSWDLLTWIAETRYVTRELVAFRFYPTQFGTKTAAHRLRQLQTWTIDGEPVLLTRPRKRPCEVFHLSAAGAQLVSDHLQMPVKSFWNDTVGMVADGIVEHYLAVTQFEVALHWYAARRGGQLLRWVREPVIPTKAGDLRPDVGFTYTEAGQTWHYAVEIDRGTEAPAKFAVKVPKYSSLHLAPFGMYWEDRPRCLVVVTTGGMVRAQRLMEEVRRLPRGPDDRRPFRYVAAEEIYVIPPSSKGALPGLATGFELEVCLSVTRAGEVRRRAVFDGLQKGGDE